MIAQPPLPPGQQLAAEGKWPLVGERQPAAGPAVWTVEVAGLVDRPLALTLDDLRAMPQVERTIDIHCVTRWSKLDCRFGGVPLAEVLALAQPRAEARFVSFLARSERGHSTSLPLADAVRHPALLAFDRDNVPLASEHGGPVRVVVPGRYFYKSLKWLTRIELLADDRLGYWEAVAGYHNEADPSREQRYIAPALTRQQAAAVLARRDFRGLDLRGLDARGHDLSGLKAAGALLRNADFRGCKLQRADLAGANLSNARLQRADLRAASLAGADVEGADFSGADLRAADFRGASLLGATFIDEANSLAAAIDGSTAFDVDRLDDLAPLQAEFVRSAVGQRYTSS